MLHSWSPTAGRTSRLSGRAPQLAGGFRYLFAGVVDGPGDLRNGVVHGPGDLLAGVVHCPGDLLAGVVHRRRGSFARLVRDAHDPTARAWIQQGCCQTSAHDAEPGADEQRLPIQASARVSPDATGAALKRADDAVHVPPQLIVGGERTHPDVT